MSGLVPLEILLRNVCYYLQNSNRALVPVNNSNYQMMRVTDERGYYKITTCGRIHVNYIVLALLGGGSFSQVVVAYDLTNKEPVAIKILKPYPQYYQWFSDEIKILNYIQKNCFESKYLFVQIKNSFIHHGFPCIVFELLGPTLANKIMTSSRRRLTLPNVRHVAICLMKGLSALRKMRIIHRDIKPENIMFVDSKSPYVKLGDFGGSYFEDNIPTFNPQTLNYRGPEVILKLPSGYENDVWSVGCVIFEASSGKMFVQGLSEHEVLINIIRNLGMPPTNMIDASPVANEYFIDGFPKLFEVDLNQKKAQRKKRHGARRRSFPTFSYLLHKLEHSDTNFIHFVQQCFQWTPETRMTPTEALNHPWFLTGK